MCPYPCSCGVAPEFRATVESVLNETEPPSEFVENAVRETVSRRRNQAEFLARCIQSLEAAKQANGYVDADAVVIAAVRHQREDDYH